MTKRKESNIIPMHRNKFYVYALFKPSEDNPFYVGKGIGERVNDHFKPSNLKRNTPKTGIIKKYGNQIRREILCYFDAEEQAYRFEEYLISVYGLSSEGGCLVNYAKTRFEYSDRFVSDFSSKGYLSRKRKYPQDLILSVLSGFYIDRISTSQLCESTKINQTYLGYVLRGTKCKSDFLKFLELNDLTKEDCETIYQQAVSQNISKGKENIRKVSDEKIIVEFRNFCNGLKTLEQLANEYGATTKYFDRIFSGAERKSLPLDHAEYNTLAGKRSHLSNVVKCNVEKFISEGLTCSQVVKLTGIGRTTYHRIKKKMKNKQIEQFNTCGQSCQQPS